MKAQAAYFSPGVGSRPCLPDVWSLKGVTKDLTGSCNQLRRPPNTKKTLYSISCHSLSVHCRPRYINGQGSPCPGGLFFTTNQQDQREVKSWGDPVRRVQKHPTLRNSEGHSHLMCAQWRGMGGGAEGTLRKCPWQSWSKPARCRP